VSRTVAIDGLSAPVRVTRDRWGIPHIYASTVADLFVAQGFVQAQDRLFQMDLWRRAAQGRLSEVLGPNFIERDAMTRRMQYRGDLESEWASYGPDAAAIASAFVRGINAWVALRHDRPPEAFVLAGWKPDVWQPADLLNRTDAFLASGDALAEIARRQLSGVIADAIRRVGTPPFFVGLATPPRQGEVPPPRGIAHGRVVDLDVALQPDQAGASRDRELISPTAYIPAWPSRADVRDGVVEVAESQARFDHPAARYLVHLNAPGWNVIGATAPWRPGVAIGHNDHLAWGVEPIDVDTQDIEVEPIGAAGTRVVKDAIGVKGRDEPFAYDTELTARGVAIASDRANGRQFALRWTGFEPGAAPELAALAIDIARTRVELEAAAATWKMPPRRFVAQQAEAARPPSDRDSSHAAAGQARQQHASANRAPTADGLPGTRAAFAHVLAITDATRRRFNVGPLPRPPRDDQPFRAVFDPRSWDASRAINAPGQSESPDSAHFADLAVLWSAGEMAPLLFSDAAVKANAESTLMLVPRR
jgi:penicillin amidase